MAIDIDGKLKLKRLELSLEQDNEKKAKLQDQIRKLMLKKQLQNLNK